MQLGERVQVVKGDQVHKGTVRYVGQVDGQEGCWVGIEWDDRERGKHDGVVGGRRYFSCGSDGSPASMVRADKVTRGVSFPEAMRRRYGAARGVTQEGGGQLHEEGMYVGTVTDRLVAVELCGKDKLAEGQSLGRLGVASLRGQSVSRAGPNSELEGLAPRVQELDLSDNLLSSWEDVTSVACSLPALRNLNLTLNRLRPCTALPSPIDGLAVLVLNKTETDWLQMLALEPFLPNLTELHLNSNGIKGIGGLPGNSSAFLSLAVLSLEDNELREWAEVQTLGGLPSLERLHLSGNRLQEIHKPAALANGSTSWAKLKSITLGSNHIASWSSIDALNAFPALKELRLSGNPLLDHARSGGRFEVIARVAKLELLNGSAVKPRERQDAELRYLRIVWAALEEAGEDKAEVESANPRLPALLDAYGPMSTGTAKLGEGDSSLSTQMLQINITCVASKAGKHMGTKTKKLPVSMTIAQLKMLCESLFKVKAKEQVIFFRGPGMPLAEHVRDEDNTRPLEYFGLTTEQCAQGAAEQGVG